MIDGRDETDNSASKRDVGVVFQNYALFPHLTVRENVRSRCRCANTGRRTAGQVDTTLGWSGFPALATGFHRNCLETAAARGACTLLVYQPSLILMDESLSALDRKLATACG